MFPWFPFVLPQTCRRRDCGVREPIREGDFIEVHTVSAPKPIEDTYLKASETSQSSCLQICYKITTRSTDDIRTKINQPTSMFFNSKSIGVCAGNRSTCSSTIPRKPVDNLNSQFFCEQKKQQIDLKNINIEQQSSPNDENKQETTNDENKQSSKKASGYTRPRTTIKIIHPPGGKSSMFW